MKKVFLICLSFVSLISLASCNNDADMVSTYVPTASSDEIDIIETDVPKTERPAVTEVVMATEPLTETASPATTEIPVTFQQEGWISSGDATYLLKTYLGSYDENGNELTFGHESTIYQDGMYYYNFRVMSLIISDEGGAHQSYYNNYLISVDGNEIKDIQ